MKARLWLALGLLVVVSGTVWTLQGLGIFGDSAMTGERVWATVGPIVPLLGLGLIVYALRISGQGSDRTPPADQ